MTDEAGQKGLMTRYLFGELAPDECADFEDAYLKDDGVFQELVALEDDIIDRYVLGDLPEAVREKFERSFLSNPDRREKVEAARALLACSAADEDTPLSDT